ncbi:MAG: hypothetical protein JNL57_04610 [Bacteroidetes bacterium]|nr:hypothetical protein [Bacteroidota bacterium]
MENQEKEPVELPETPETPQPEETAAVVQPPKAIGPWGWVRFGSVVFLLMVFYIYNQHHANKALRKKDKLLKELKELHSEKISLESEITNASKQSELAKKLESTGLKELNQPPVKIEYYKEKK